MAKARAAAVCKQIIRLVGSRVDIATGVTLSLLWQANAAAASESDPAAAPAFDPRAGHRGARFA